jgi:LysR family hydrogen peroxide-inducible transcriptional activator
MWRILPRGNEIAPVLCGSSVKARLFKECCCKLTAMTLQQMMYLVALDDHRHFVKAANSCSISQPTLTMQIQKLEEEVGALLIDRSVSPLVPTPLGMEIIETSRRVLNEISALKSKINNEVEKLEGSFQLAVIPTIAPYLLPLWLPRWMSDPHPIQLHISELQTQQIITQLKSGEIDMGILTTPLEDNELVEIPLFYEPFFLFVSEGHPLFSKKEVSMEELNGDEMLLLEEGHCFRSQALAMCGGRKEINKSKVNYVAGSIDTLIALVEKGGGYTVVPEMALRKEISQRNVVPFSGVPPVREVSLVVHRRFSRKAVLEFIQSFIEQGIPNHLRKPIKYRRIAWI